MGDSIVIYQISDYVTNTLSYVCPDQATIDDGKAIGYVGDFSIGTQTDADTISNTNQQNWLTFCADRFSVNKDIDPDPIQTTWIVCDLNTEAFNTDQDYNIFNVVNGFYAVATGLDNAKTLLEQTKQSFLSFYYATPYESYEVWPPKKKPISEGTQSL